MAPTISHQHIAFERGPVFDNSKICTISWYKKKIYTTVTCDPFAVCNWIKKINTIYYKKYLKGLVVGLHVQTFDNKEIKKSSIGTLQLCVENHCLVFQICHANSITRRMRDFLNDENYVFVGVGVKETLAKVVDNRNSKVFGDDVKCVDLGWLAANKVYELDFMKNLELKDLARLTMKAKLLKPTLKTESKWDDECLSDAQVLVAALDAIVSYQVGVNLNAASLFTFVQPDDQKIVVDQKALLNGKEEKVLN